jgi:hypothetical protein
VSHSQQRAGNRHCACVLGGLQPIMLGWPGKQSRCMMLISSHSSDGASIRYPRVYTDMGTSTRGIRYLRPSDAGKNDTTAWGSTLVRALVSMATTKMHEGDHAPRQTRSLAPCPVSRTTGLLIFFYLEWSVPLKALHLLTKSRNVQWELNGTIGLV